MESPSKYLKKVDWVLFFSAILLTFAGLLSIYSSSFFKGDFLNFKKQIFFLVLGIILMVFFSLIDWRTFRENPYLILAFYFLNLCALAFLFLFAPITNGTRGWYRFGLFAIDPIEPMKLILIILLAKYFSMRHIEMYRISHIFISGIYVLLPSLLIFLQPDLGSVLILLLLWLGVLIISGIEIRHFLILVLLFCLVFAFSWSQLLKEYQKERIMSFIAPNLEPLGMGWSQFQSKIALGSGGIFGKGFRGGSQVQYGFLTAPQTDFIFSAIGEEFGFLGITFLLGLIFIFFLRTIRIAFEAKTNFPRLFATGFAVLFTVQIFIHIGMNLGILPIIGISLPFVSYGGGGLIANYVGLGILQSLKINKD